MSTGDGLPLVPELIHAPGCTGARAAFGRINFELRRREVACPECGRAVPIPWDYEERRRWATRTERERVERERAAQLREQVDAALEARRLEADGWMRGDR